MAAKFGTSGLRGLADDLSDVVVRRYVSVFLNFFPHSGALVVGRDLRASSPRITDAVVASALNEGVQVLDCGVLPTPALALECAARWAPGVMVTGSHIPADRNGLKFYTQGGEFTKADESILLRGVSGGRDLPGKGLGRVSACNALERYAARYRDFVSKGALSGRRIGVWQHSSAAREVLPEILAALGAEVILLAPSDDFVAVDTEAISGDVRDRLAGWAKQHGLDAIVSTDGDADRPLLADETGAVVPGDILGPICARALGAGDLVTTVSANTLVEAMGHFDSVSRCRIGSPYVIEMMKEKIASGVEGVLGYEPNGGVLLGFEARKDGRVLGPLLTRDAVLPIVAVLVAASGGTVSALVSGLPNRRTATDRLVDVPPEVSAAIVADVLAGQSDLVPVALGAIRAIDTTEGARLTLESGVILTIRSSGNAPELRCYVEADSASAAAAVLEDMLARLAARVEEGRK